MIYFSIFGRLFYNEILICNDSTQAPTTPGRYKSFHLKDFAFIYSIILFSPQAGQRVALLWVKRAQDVGTLHGKSLSCLFIFPALIGNEMPNYTVEKQAEEQ